MTPGFAKSRQELFWLPYPEPNRVIINAHNFPSLGFDPSVNGKTPLGAWIPSLDDVGNETSTLYDFVGSANGVFSDSTPKMGWIDDTESGGVRAVFVTNTLPFPAVVIPAFATGVTAWSMSWWQKLSTLSGFPVVQSWNNGSVYFHVPYSTTLSFYNSRPTNRPTVALTANVWAHIGIVETGTVGKLYVNGNFVADFTGGSAGSINSRSLRIGSQDISNGGFNGRFDDIRVWGQVLDLTDFGDLYAAQRGGNAA